MRTMAMGIALVLFTGTIFSETLKKPPEAANSETTETATSKDFEPDPGFEFEEYAYYYALPALWFGASIYLREGAYSNNPMDNPAGYINGIGGSILAASLIGGMAGGFAAVWLFSQNAMDAFVWFAIGFTLTSVTAGLTATYYSIRHRDDFNRHSSMYYASSSAVLLIPLAHYAIH